MIESLIGIVAVVVLIVVVTRQNTRLGLLERELGALRSFVLSLPQGAGTAAASAPAAAAVVPASAEAPEGAAESARVATGAPAGATSVEAAATEPVTATQADEADATAAAAADAPAAAHPAPHSAAPKKPDIETALGTRWAVWVGGLALALGGIFLIRYSIEAGIFGPGVRLTLAALLGIVLLAGGEFVRRTGFTGPVEGAAGAYVPGILTAAGAFTLFGTIYAAHGLYGFIGPAAAFLLLGAVGLGTIAAALVHGQALAGVGLLGSMATPALVSSQSPSAWALFGFLAVVLAANTAVARLRDWVLLAAAGFAGTGIWCLLYVLDSSAIDLRVVLFINAVALAALAFSWLARRDEAKAPVDWPSVVVALFVALAAETVMSDTRFAGTSGPASGAVLLAALVAVALLRAPALPLFHAAGIAAVLVHLRLVIAGTYLFELTGGDLAVEGAAMPPVSPQSVPVGAALSAVLLAAGYHSARRLAASAPQAAAAWTFWATLAPLVVVASLWAAFGNLDRDLSYAAVTFALAILFAAGAEWIARAEQPPLAGGLAVTFALCGAGAAAVLGIHMAFSSLLTTVLVGGAAIVPALATRLRRYPVLGWLSVAAAVAVLGRVAFDPTIVGADLLGRAPVFNALLPGYGIPALAFAFAAWQLAHTTDGRPRLAMEASAALFSLLTVAMLVRHAMHGGVIDAGAPTLAEQAIYTLIALGAGAILVSIDMRSPSSVLRIGSMAVGVLSVIFVVGQHFLFLNPLFTDESTGGVPVFNLLFLAYLLPAIAAGGLALYARGKRPYWYSAMLGVLSALLAFVYATLSVRRLFHGEHIALWAGMGQVETYSYSALWLAVGVGLLVLGVIWASQVLRIASAALIAVAVAKVFVYDMRELEGVLRALSFIGLGAVLIGIGLFYQRLLTRSGARAPEQERVA